MKKIIGSSIGVILCFLSIIGGECAESRINLVDDGTVTVERVDSRQARIVNVNVYQDGEGIVISGTVRRKSTTVAVDKGHVDVVVFSPDGNIIQEVIARYTPRLTKKRRSAQFSVRIETSLPNNSIVRMVHHTRAH